MGVGEGDSKQPRGTFHKRGHFIGQKRGQEFPAIVQTIYFSSSVQISFDKLLKQHTFQ